MKLEKVLENYGLTKKQALLYITCLELGSASVYRIAKKANLSRSTCYEVLEDLREKKLVTIFQKKKVKYYNAEDPRRAIDIDRGKIKTFEKALPEFNALYGNAKIKPTVRFYEGKTGMKIILEEILDEAKEILGFSSAEDYITTLEEYLPIFLEKRLKKRIPIKSILRESPKAQGRKKMGSEQLREVRFIPADRKHHSMITIWKNKIAMFSFQKEMMALVVESKELAQSQRIMFNLVWDSLKKE